MKKIIYNAVVVALIMLIFIVFLMLLDNRIRNYERATAKMGIDWETNTCYLYWE